MMRWLLIVIAVSVAVPPEPLTARQMNAEAEKRLAAAQQKASVDGDLKAAIDEYKRIVAAAGRNRQLAARALLGMAECYQKLGDAQARETYERILRDYAEQQDEVRLARSRLGPASAAGRRAMAMRKVWEGPEVAPEGSVSPDGRYISYPKWITGDLAIHDLATGEDRVIVDSHNYANGSFAQGSAISRDGKQIAYAWFNNDRYELRVVGLQPHSEPRVLVNNSEISFIIPSDWSADGKWIAVQVQRKDQSALIGLVSVGDGTLRVLKSVGWRGALSVFFSPDGKYLAYDLPTSESDDNERDVFVLRADASRETPAVVSPGFDRVIGWSPDSKRLLFASDRTGTRSLWSVPITDGQPIGPATLIKPDVAGSSLGVTASGSLFLVTGIGIRDVQTARIDSSSGRVLSAPASVVRSFVGTSLSPAWSRDGNQLAYLSARDEGRNRVLVIQSATGGERVLHVAMSYFGEPDWSPDGRSLVVKGTDRKGRKGIFRIDAQSGATDLVVLAADTGASAPKWSADGRKIYYFGGKGNSGSTGAQFIERDLQSGSERIIFAGAGPGWPSLSPDGRTFAGVSAAARSSVLELIPVDGGERRVLLRLDAPKSFTRGATWTPDGRHVIVVVQQQGSPQMWFVPVEGGAPRVAELDVRKVRGPINTHPDGEQIAYASGDAAAEVWVLENFLPASTPRQTDAKK